MNSNEEFLRMRYEQKVGDMIELLRYVPFTLGEGVGDYVLLLTGVLLQRTEPILSVHERHRHWSR